MVNIIAGLYEVLADEGVCGSCSAGGPHNISDLHCQCQCTSRRNHSRHVLRRHEQMSLLGHESAFACPSEQPLNDLAICFGLRECTDVH